MISVNFGETKRLASSGNRTRAAHVAGEHSTTEPTMLTIRIVKIVDLTIILTFEQ